MGKALTEIVLMLDLKKTKEPDQGRRTSLRAFNLQLSTLFAFFADEGVLGLSDATIDAAIVAESRRAGRSNGVYWLAVTHQPYTELEIIDARNTTSVLRYSLPDQVRCQPNVKELRALQRSVNRIYEIAGEKPK